MIGVSFFSLCDLRPLTRDMLLLVCASKVHLRKVERLNRLIKDSHFDATVFNCIVAIFGKTSIYKELQNIKDTQCVGLRCDRMRGSVRAVVRGDRAIVLALLAS